MTSSAHHLVTRGIVLREVRYRDADRILDILTPDLGLITASARGARRQKSPLLYLTQALSFCEFQLYRHGRGQYTVDGASGIAEFPLVQRDMTRLVCASHMAELMCDATRDDPDGAAALFRLTAVTLAYLNREDRDPLLVVRTMELRLMCEIGYTPVLDACAVCTGPLPAEDIRFGFRVFGTVCARPGCRREAGDGETLTPGALACMRYIRDVPLERLYLFRLAREDQDVLSRISERFVRERMEKEYRRLDMLSTL